MGKQRLCKDICAPEQGKGRRTGNPGFTVIELLVALLIMTSVSTMMVPIIRLLVSFGPEETFYQDEIGIYQLQVELAINDIVEVRDDSIVYAKQGEEFELHIINGKLISQAGTLDFIHAIDQVWVEVSNDIVYVIYERDEQRFEWPLAYFRP